MLSALLIGNHLSASGRNPTVSEELARRFRQDGMHIVTTSDRAGRLARLGDMLRTTWSRRQHYDVAQIDVYSGPAFIWAEAVAAALAALSKPFVLSLHGGNLPRFAATHGRRVRRLLRAAHTATCPSAYLARELRHLRADIRIVPNPLDTAKYRSPVGGDTDRASRRGVACYARLPLAPRIVWMRGFHKMYDPLTAVAAFSAVHKRHPAATLAMHGPELGDGSLASSRRLAARLGLQSAIRFLGPAAKSEVPRILSHADIFLNTSRVDNAPLSVVEAMAAGLCVISSDCGGIPDLIDHKKQGLLIEPGDAPGFARAMHTLLDSPTLAAELSIRAGARAQALDWQWVLPRWRSILREAARQ